jgi:hypothetical protein
MNKPHLKIADLWEALPTKFQREKTDVVFDDDSIKPAYVFTGRNIG